MNHYSKLRSLGLILATGACAYALDADVRLVPQLEMGSSGFEPGIAAEWRDAERHAFVIRPELFLNEDGGLGGGAAVLGDFSRSIDLPTRYAVAAGPRLVYHNSDDSGWEVDAMLTMGCDLSNINDSWRHSVGLIGAIGALEDTEHDDVDVGVTAGIYYAYRL